jgi:hypothetical protein
MKAKQPCRGCGIAPLIHAGKASRIPNSGKVDGSCRQSFSTCGLFPGMNMARAEMIAAQPIVLLYFV